MAAKNANLESQNDSHFNSQNHNKAIVESLYKALASGNGIAVANLLASDLEWWFHGPPHCQHMMRVLTGEASTTEFMFEPRSVTAIDDARVVVEGWPEGAAQAAYWVHVWTVNKDGLIVQFREYFNTWLTVRDLRPTPTRWEVQVGHVSGTLWQSQPSPNTTRSMPGLVLAI